MGENILQHKSVSWKVHFNCDDYLCNYDDAGDNVDKIDAWQWPWFDGDFDNNDDDGDDFVTGFDKHPLVLAENPRTHQFYVPLDSPKVE